MKHFAAAPQSSAFHVKHAERARRTIGPGDAIVSRETGRRAIQGSASSRVVLDPEFESCTAVEDDPTRSPHSSGLITRPLSSLG